MRSISHMNLDCDLHSFFIKTSPFFLSALITTASWPSFSRSCSVSSSWTMFLKAFFELIALKPSSTKGNIFPEPKLKFFWRASLKIELTWNFLLSPPPIGLELPKSLSCSFSLNISLKASSSSILLEWFAVAVASEGWLELKRAFSCWR